LTLKTRLKKTLRRSIAALNGLGLGLLVRRLGGARGAGIIMTHCVGSVPETDYLPADMKTSTAKVEKLLRALRRRRVRCVPVRELVAALDRGEPASRLCAFTMDDGYRDNATEALPLLRRHGAGGTVFVETHVVESREPSWMHRYFWITHRRGEEFFAREYADRTREPAIRDKLLAAAPGGAANGSGRGARYDLKRILKYEAGFADRDRVTREILAAAGGDDRDIARAYLTWEDVAALDGGGVEIGAHTVHHEILSRLDDTALRREIEGSTRALRGRTREPVVSFAYPFGRTWDYDARCYPLLRELGYTSSCAAIDGTNEPGTDRMQLKRLPLNDEIPLNEVLAELDGTLPLARRLLRIRL
jgi:peptidoglycan/xylan/chitin deacetylase (PgdA/CDA1 family)